MTEISPLRRRMIEDMMVRNLSPATQRSYVHAVAKFGRFFGCSPDRLDLEDVRALQVHLVAGGISWPALNQTVCALRFIWSLAQALRRAVFSFLRQLRSGPSLHPKGLRHNKRFNRRAFAVRWCSSSRRGSRLA
jgi:hypothetical protein